MGLVDKIVAIGTHTLGIKDMQVTFFLFLTQLLTIVGLVSLSQRLLVFLLVVFARSTRTSRSMCTRTIRLALVSLQWWLVPKLELMLWTRPRTACLA